MKNGGTCWLFAAVLVTAITCVAPVNAGFIFVGDNLGNVAKIDPERGNGVPQGDFFNFNIGDLVGLAYNPALDSVLLLDDSNRGGSGGGGGGGGGGSGLGSGSLFTGLGGSNDFGYNLSQGDGWTNIDIVQFNPDGSVGDVVAKLSFDNTGKAGYIGGSVVIRGNPGDLNGSLGSGGSDGSGGGGIVTLGGPGTSSFHTNPEPSSMILLAIGAGCAMGAYRRRMKQKKPV